MLQANSAIPHFAGAVKTSCPHFVAAVKTFCISCSTNKPEPVCTSGDLSVTFTSSDNSDNEQNEDSDDEQDESSDDEQDEGSNDEQDDGSDDEQDEDSADVNPSEDDNSDGSADDHDQQDKEHETDKDSDVDKESDHDMERENDEDNDLDAESNLVFVWHSASNTWVKQNIDDGSFDDFEYDIIQHTVHNVRLRYTYKNFLQTAGLQDGASHCTKILSSMYAL